MQTIRTKRVSEREGEMKRNTTTATKIDPKQSNVLSECNEIIIKLLYARFHTFGTPVQCMLVGDLSRFYDLRLTLSLSNFLSLFHPFRVCIEMKCARKHSCNGKVRESPMKPKKSTKIIVENRIVIIVGFGQNQ